MKKFHFRLDSYLKISRHQEELEQIRLFEILRDREEVRAKLEKNQVDQSAAQAFWAEIPIPTASQAVMHENYMQRLRHQRIALEEKLHRVNDKLEAQQERLKKTTQRCEVIEKLKKRRKQDYESQADRWLQRESDDLFLQRKHSRPD